MKDNELELKIEKLAQELQSKADYPRPILNHDRKEAMKRHIFEQIKLAQSQRMPFSFMAIINAIKEAVKNLRLSPYKRATLKEHILSMVETHSQKTFFWSNFFAFSRRVVSATLIIVIVFGLFTFMNAEVGVVRAATFTTLGSFSGGVLVERKGEFIDAKPGMQIFERDQIITGEDGMAVIEYFDDSVSRLANNTHLVVERLAKPRANSIATYVEIDLLDGTLWSKVVNLVDKDSSFVVTADDVYASAKKAAFNVTFEDEVLEIGVYRNTIDLQSGEASEHVLSGEKVVVDTESRELSKSKIDAQEKEEEWVKENLESDKQYLDDVEKRLLAAKMEAVGLDVTDDVNFETTLSQHALLFLTFDDVKKKKIELDMAEENFVAAQVKLHDPNITQEQKAAMDQAVIDFSLKVQEFYDLVAVVSSTDAVYGKELKNYIDEKIAVHKKDMSVVSPTSPLFELRPVLDELELLKAEDESELVQIKAEQVADKLAVVEEISGEGGKDDDAVAAANLAKEAANDYKEAINIVDTLAEGETAEKEKKDELVDELSKEFGLFEATPALTTTELYQLQDEVFKVTGELLPPLVTSEPLPVLSPPVIIAPAAGFDAEVLPPEDSPETIVEGPFGVDVKGDKPLPPELQDIN